MATAAKKTYRLVGKKRVWDMDRNDQTLFPFDWAAWLAGEGAGVEIVDVEWVLGSNVTKVQGGFDTATAAITVKFTNPQASVNPDDPAATMEAMHIVTCRMTTNQTPPQIRDRSIYLNPVTE